MITFQIKRVKLDNKGNELVDNSEIEFSLEMTFVDAHSLKKNYFLHSLILHYGKSQSGHYKCIIFDHKKEMCYMCSDQKIKTIGYHNLEKYKTAIVGFHYIRQEFNINTYNFHENRNGVAEYENIGKRTQFITINVTKQNEIEQFFNDTMNIIKQKDLEHSDSIPAIPTEVLLYREKIRSKVKPLKVENNGKLKHSYSKTSEAKRQEAYDLFIEFGTSKNVQFYALKLGIRLPTMYKMLKQLKEGNFQITPTPHTGGAKSKVSLEYAKIIEKEIKNDPRITLKQMEQAIDDHNKSLKENSIEQKMLPSSKSIHRYLHSKACVEQMGNTMSFKRLSTRSVGANNPENLQLRKERIKELYKKISSGAMWICVDETSWNVDFRFRRPVGWGKTGEKTCFEYKTTHFVATAITAISMSGKTFCILIKGSTDKGIFNAFLSNMLDSFSDEGPLVVWLDNCGIHNDATAIINNSNHSVVFNAPGSPELNPIENIFGIWKDEVENSAKRWDDDNNILEKIKDCFFNLDKALVRKVMESNKGEQWSKVFDLEVQ